jgi:hypothetical protein
MKGTIVALLGAAAIGVGLAGTARAETPIEWQIEVKLGPYKANIDREFSGATPFEDVYGSADVLMGLVEIDYQFWRDVGSLGVGLTAGYALDKGTAIDPSTNTKSGDSTAFNIVPISASLVYTFDYLAIEYDIPFVPFAKAGLDYWVWWFRDSNEDIARSGGAKGQGATAGWHVGGGIKFLLDWFDPHSANSFDMEIGVNNSYIFAEFILARVDDFGKSSSLRVGDELFMFGLAFEL